jgi:hypothetical protein
MVTIEILEAFDIEAEEKHCSHCRFQTSFKEAGACEQPFCLLWENILIVDKEKNSNRRCPNCLAAQVSEVEEDA